MTMKVMAVCFLLTAACEGQTVDELIAKNLVARGGAEKLRAIQTIRITGTIKFSEESSPLNVQVRRPNQIMEDFKVEGTAVTRAYDGTAGWQEQESGGEALTAPLDDGELTNIQEEAENAIEGPLLDYAKKGSKAEALGKDTVNGRLAYKVKITTHIGTTITQFLDATTYLEIHEEIERSANGKLMTIVEDVYDYRDVGGVKYPYRFMSGPKGSPPAAEVQVEKMEFNVPIDASVFVMPK